MPRFVFFLRSNFAFLHEISVKCIYLQKHKQKINLITNLKTYIYV